MHFPARASATLRDDTGSVPFPTRSISSSPHEGE